MGMIGGGRRVLAACACMAALAAAGCGGDGEDGGRWDAQDVIQVFGRGADVELVSRPAGTYDALSLPSSTEAAGRDRLGAFNIYVTKDEESRDLFKRDNSGGEVGDEIKPAAGGIYWQAAASGQSWTARKFYDNVVLEWIAGKEKRTDERWRRLNLILGNLGRKPAEYRLPPEEQPCEKNGITPAGPGKEGTCRFGEKTLTVVDSGTPLRLPTVRIDDADLEVERRIVSRRYGLTRRIRPKGAFVIVRYDVENVGKNPIGSFRAGLVVGEKRYDPDDRNQFYVQDVDDDPYPIQPDQSAEVVSLFDVPEEVAEAVEKEGALEVSGDEDFSSPEYADKLGRVRLSR